MCEAGILRLTRHRFGLSQRDVGKIVGVTGAHIAMVEAGRRHLAPARARKLINYFRLPRELRLELMDELTEEQHVPAR